LTATTQLEGPWQLVALAEQKLGTGATVHTTRDGWTAELVDRQGVVTNIKRVTGKTWTALALFLEHMPDVES
jgi:hypothetical protein